MSPYRNCPTSSSFALIAHSSSESSVGVRPQGILLGCGSEERSRREPVILCDEPSLARHVHRPWFRAYVQDRLGDLPAPNAGAPPEVVSVSDAELRRHTVITGATGSGKSRIMRHLLLRQVLEGGCSLVLLDPKGELYQDFLLSLAEASFPPERTILVDPRTPDSIPGWNPFLEP